MHTLYRFLGNEAGQDIVEYSLLIVFVLTLSLAIMQTTGASVKPIWIAENTLLENAATIATS